MLSETWIDPTASKNWRQSCSCASVSPGLARRRRAVLRDSLAVAYSATAASIAGRGSAGGCSGAGAGGGSASRWACAGGRLSARWGAGADAVAAAHW
jgi:hypothetical protein